MELRFKYTVWERVFFVSRATILELFRTRVVLILLGAAWLIMGVLPGNSDAGFYGAWLPLLGPVLFLLVVVLLAILSNLVILRQHLKEERTICIRDGKIFLEMLESKTTTEYLCKTVESVKVSGPLIWLELPLSRKNRQYLLIPTRKFDSRLERGHFLEYFQRQQNIEPTLEPDTVRQAQQAEWYVEFILELDAWISVNAQATAIRKRRLLGHSLHNCLSYFAIMVGLVGVLVLEVGRGESVDVAVLIFAGVFMVAICQYIMHQPVREDSLRRQQKWGLLREDVVGSWELFFNEEGIDYMHPSASGRMMWNQMKWLAESDDWIFMFTPKRQAVFYFEKALFENDNKRLDFVAYCQDHGMEYKRIRPMVEKKSPPLSIRVIKVMAVIMGMVVILFIGMLITILIRFAIKEVPYETQKQYVESTTSFAFRPELYKNYVPLDEQVAVLSSLGFRISEESVNQMKEWMEEWPESRAWVEGYPYTSLLAEVGAPEKNRETREVERYSDQAYWFDFEAWDISLDYIQMLNGINALSSGAFSITEVTTDDSQVDWEKGTGVMMVEFKLNGTAYSYPAQKHNDWLDEGIIVYVSQLIEEEDLDGHIYCTDDSGQGAILFYRDNAWADEFAQKTGITLQTPGFPKNRGIQWLSSIK